MTILLLFYLFECRKVGAGLLCHVNYYCSYWEYKWNQKSHPALKKNPVLHPYRVLP